MNLQNREKGKSETEKNSDGEVAGGDKKLGELYMVWRKCGVTTQNQNQTGAFSLRNTSSEYTQTRTHRLRHSRQIQECRILQTPTAADTEINVIHIDSD